MAEFISYKELLSLIRQEMAPGKPLVLAVDGRAAAGKSTLAANLNLALGAGVVHMDDFYLPRAQQGGMEVMAGNMDKDRFLQEVISPLKNGTAFAYRAFDCRQQDFAPGLVEINRPIIVVEGAYSLLPLWGRYYALSLFVDIEPSRQRARIRQRNGEEGLKAFLDEWIPREEAYFDACQVKQRCQYIIQ